MIPKQNSSQSQEISPPWLTLDPVKQAKLWVRFAEIHEGCIAPNKGPFPVHEPGFHTMKRAKPFVAEKRSP